MSFAFVDLASELAPLRADIDAAVARVLDSQRFIGGPELSAFETELAALTSVAHAVGVSSGTDALLAGLMALGVGPGDEVVTTPFSFFATAGVIARLGATPVFVDIEEETFNMDPVAAASRVGNKTAAVIPVHLFGRPASLPEVECPILEDAAQSVGASSTQGAMSALSFFPTKNLGCCGDGGAILTNDAELAERLRVLRSQGGKPKYYHAVVGGNFRLDALQAAILRVKLPHLRVWIAARRERAHRYRELFADRDLCAVMPSDDLQHVYNQFVIRVPRRDELRAALAKEGIPSEIYYPVPLHRQEAFADLGYREGSLPNAEAAAKDVLALPVSPGLTEAQQDRVVEGIARFYRS